MFSPSVAAGSSRIRGRLVPRLYKAFSPLGFANGEAILRFMVLPESYGSKMKARRRLRVIQSPSKNRERLQKLAEGREWRDTPVEKEIVNGGNRKQSLSDGDRRGKVKSRSSGEMHTKGYSDEKSYEEARRRRIEFHNWWKEGQPKIRNGKTSTTIHHKSGMEVVSRNNHSEVEGAMDEDKLHVLSKCLVGWCKDYQNRVKNDESQTPAKWFSRVEAWSESLVVECRRVCQFNDGSIDLAAQVWRVNGQKKVLLPASDQSKFYCGDCYIFQYSYPGEDKEEYLIGTWIGKQSVEEERVSAVSLATKMVEALKFQATQTCIHEASEPIQFFSIFQSFIVFKVASSLNSSYCYILHSGSTIFTWAGNLSSPDDHELVERKLDIIKPNLQSKSQKEGSESEQFWELLGGKSEYPSQKIAREPEGDPHLFSCTFSKGNIKVTEIYNFTQDDLMTEDIFILDCHSDIFVWVGQEVDSKNKLQALTICQKFLEQDVLLENLSREAPIYIVMEGSEPPFFTRFFAWDSAKSAMHGNSFQRKLTIVKTGCTPAIDKPKRRTPISHGGRSSSVPDRSQRSRSMSFSPERVRVRGRSPAFNALAAAFENPNATNLSTPPPVAKKLYPKSVTPDSAKKSAAITASFEQPPPARETIIPRAVKVSPPTPKSTPEPNSKENSMSSKLESLTIQEDAKEGEAEDEEGLSIYPYERLKITSTDPVSEIDVTKRETYLSSKEFKEKFGMKKDAFYKLPKWKQNKLKMALQLF
ncbi:Villin-5 [Hibiscus syriacus]|uniref:Villin-5 n=1 Tax=Hibiscus syriacus TaxID=106335 RepID=A0A6A2WYU1_HIBSY|nr:Villin-5 [Hibiscus syriacus]